MRRITSGLLFVVLLASLTAPRATSVASPAKVPLDYKAYDSWNLIRGTKLSDDGTWIAYVLAPEDGDPTLVVRNLTSGQEYRKERGQNPEFTPDSKWVVYAIRAKNEDIHKAEREHKLPAEQPKNGLGVLSLVDGHVTNYDRVKSVKLPRDIGYTTIAILEEAPAPSPKPSGSPPPAAPPPTASPAPTPTETPALPRIRRTPIRIESSPLTIRYPLSEPVAANSPAPAASPSPSASPDELHKIEPGTQLLIRELDTTVGLDVRDVSDVAISHDGRYVAYAIAAKDAKRDRLRVLQRKTEEVYDILLGPGHYKNLTFAQKRDSLAFVSDEASFTDTAPYYGLYQTNLVLAAGEKPVTAPMVGPASHGMPGGWAPSVNATLSYSKDAARLFFGTAPRPTPVPSGTPEPMKVDIWSWRDGDLQPYQKINADKERKRTYAAVSHTGDEYSVVQLAWPTMRNLTTNDNGTIAIGTNDLPYRALFSWAGEEYADVYAVSLRDGSRRLLQRKSPDPGRLSPDGRFLVAYDPPKRDWYAIDTGSAKRRELTATLPTAFYDAEDDHPRPPQPYAFGGWVDGGKYVLLLDRYDVWAVELASGRAWILTQGAGRTSHVRFYPLQLDADRDSFDAARPIVLRAFNDDTKDSGLYLARLNGLAENRLRKIMMAPKWVSGTLRARNAERIVLTQQRLDEVPDLWTAPALGGALAKISDANPQKSRYIWASDKLISYKSAWGKPLHGILITPENFNPHKKYPMLVYIYERFADELHHPPFSFPTPGTSPTLLRYASNGYVVLIPDIAYRNGHPGPSALDCVMPAIDEVVKRGFVDPKRIGIAGHSWGAYEIIYMITRTDRFRAVEAGAAVANMTSAYGGIRWGSGLVREFQYEVDQSRIGATPWDRLDLYTENSALFHIKNIHTPYLTIANDADGAVPWYQGIEFITAMRRLGKEAYLFQFDGEDHNLRGREQQKYWTVHLDEYFDHFLKGAPEPNWMKATVPYIHRGERDVRPLYGEKP
jgi:dipeptidyl aminopeptidase/acylaminoacyl peptidase